MDIDFLSVDVSSGDVSSGNAVLPVFPTVPDMVEESLEWYSPAFDEAAAEVSVSALSADELALLHDLKIGVMAMVSLLGVLCFFSGMAVGISLIKCFFIWRG